MDLQYSSRIWEITELKFKITLYRFAYNINIKMQTYNTNYLVDICITTYVIAIPTEPECLFI